MPFYTYILKSKIKDRFYIGSSSNLEKRLQYHNQGKTKSTKPSIPWEIVYYEKFDSKSDALKREKQLKKIKNKKYIHWLIFKHSGSRPV
ncbi:MAG: GIY-YIG nuclease family protein [Ignavibacteria bacterium]|nr:GIY-YIG nuclease family protein [Ignavibacteria bacterium]